VRSLSKRGSSLRKESWQARILTTLASPVFTLWMPWILAACAGLVYLLTMSPRLTWEHAGRDGGDLITAARFLGVPHPTGYPTYTLLAWVFTHIPYGSVAWRVNLFSGVAAAGTVMLLYLIGQRLFPERQNGTVVLGSAVGALLLAFAPLFWEHATVAEVYALHLFFVALVLWLMLRWRDGEGPLALAALAFGLGLGNRITVTFMGPTILMLLWSGRRRLSWRAVWLAVLALVAGSLVYLYLPWRASQGPLINWGDPDTWEGFKWVVTGQGYRRFFFALPANKLGTRLGDWADLTGSQFPYLAWPLAILGLWDLARRDRWFALGTVAHAGVNLIYSIGYNTTDAFVYLLPVYLYAALWMGQGAAILLSGALDLARWERRPNFFSALVMAGLVLLPLISLVEEWDGMDLTNERRAANYAIGALETVEPDALILVGSDAHTFAFWYYRYVEQVRTDVAIVNYAMLTFDWYRETIKKYHPEILLPPPANSAELKQELTRLNMVERPVYVAEEEYMEDFTLVPVGPDFLEDEGFLKVGS
jgi:4-amino-4-deoxy-L-arabinose transferase-like glycosyltransferase